LSEKVSITLVATNDIANDQRVLKIAETLAEEGYSVTVICRKLPNRPSLPILPFATIRKNMWFKKGLLFYASFNVAFFFDLLFSKVDIITANDLDTLPACALVAIMRRKFLVYDSHELFIEVPELNGRHITKTIWFLFEKLFIRKANAVSTVCDSIAKELKSRYKKDCVVIRNVPQYHKRNSFEKNQNDVETKTLLYQGALNTGRGIEQMIGSMLFLYDVKLIIAGTGYLEKALKQMVTDLELNDKVEFAGLLSPSALQALTRKAHLGLSLEENICKNYEYALPNKLFDYIQARVPVITSNLPEMRRIIDKYKVGTSIDVKESHELALIVKNILDHEQLHTIWKNNCNVAASDLCWEKERSKLIDMYKTLKTP
jgi:glycosyltransferase involved in cell wall biosynthesis